MGAQLAKRLNDRIDEIVEGDEDTSRADVIAAMGSAAGVDAGTVNDILSGSINCPPLNRLAGFARVLSISAGSLRTAAEDDGCSYDERGIVLSCGVPVQKYSPGEHCRRAFIITRQEGSDGGPMRIVASDNSVDRMGDIVEQDWRLGDFERNPVMLWGHNSSIPPVGRALNLRIEDVDGRRALTFEPKWDTGPHNLLANTVAEQFRNGTLNAVSVGFVPGVVTPRAALEEHDERFANTGLILGQNGLLEISPVTIPANANALAIRSVPDAAAELIEKAKAEAKAIVDAALAAVPELVVEALKAVLPAEVLAAVQGKEVRALIKGHLDAMPDDSGTTVEDWLAEAKDLEDADNVTSIEEWLGKADQSGA